MICIRLFAITGVMSSTRVFISWSGVRSKHVALALRDWLLCVFPDVDPFVSSANIQAGQFWDDAIKERIRTSRFCVVCVTPANRTSEWLHYEAGAMAEGMGIRVAPYLLGVKMHDLSGPMKRLQATFADQEGTLALVMSMAAAIGVSGKDQFLKNAVAKNWSDLEKQLAATPAEETPVGAERTSDLDYIPLMVSDETVLQLLQQKLAYTSTETFLFDDLERELRLPPGSAKRCLVAAAGQRFEIAMAPESARLARKKLPLARLSTSGRDRGI